VTATPARRPTAYDVADRYDDRYFGDLAGRYLHRTRFARQRVANVMSLLPGDLSGLRVLDLGCGMGTFTVETAKRGARAIGVDLAPAALPHAARIAAAGGGDARGGSIAFVRADAAKLPFRTHATDLVIAADFTEHLDDETLARVLGEAARVLRPEGRLIVYTPSPSHILERLRVAGILRDQDPSHIGMRTATELAAALEAAGLKVVHLGFLPSHLPVLNTLERVFGASVPLLRRRIGIVARRPAVEAA